MVLMQWMKGVIAVKIGKLVLKNKWQMCMAAIVSLCVFGRAWTIRPDELWKTTENQEGKSDVDDSDHVARDIGTKYDSRAKVQYTKDGSFLVDKNGEILCGPYKWIEEDDLWLDMCRFVGDNGLIGYLSTADGHIVIDPIYTKASKMNEGSACVSEGKGIYYISETGEKITEHDYADGYPFDESQGSYARVQLEDETWAIINKEEEILLDELDAVNKLPVVTVFGSAVRKGHALLFELSYGNEVRLIKEYEEFCEISEVYWGEFAIVKNKEGLYGVVGRDGDVIVTDQYLSIDWIRVNLEDKNECIMFKAQRKDGMWDTVAW